MSITDKAREAAELKQQQRLQAELEAAVKAASPETGRYRDFDPQAPQGRRYRVYLTENQSNVFGEFISPKAPESGATVACYHSANNQWLFDCL